MFTLANTQPSHPITSGKGVSYDVQQITMIFCHRVGCRKPFLRRRLGPLSGMKCFKATDISKDIRKRWATPTCGINMASRTSELKIT